MWGKIKAFFSNLFKKDKPVITSPVISNPSVPTGPVIIPIPPSFQELPKKGWFREYDEIIKDNLSDKKNLLKYNDDPIFWVAFFKAVAKAESNHNPFSTYWERNLNGGVDPITGMKYLSEGLLQLSYVDAKWHGCDFCIDTDRNKKSDDVTKTIFNPEKNLKCGLIILDKLMRKHNTPYWNKSHYWAVLKPANNRHKVFKKYLERYLKGE